MEQNKIRTYRDLVVWQKSINILTEIYRVTKHFPKQEAFGLVLQIRKSSISIPSNIAEGYSRYSNREFTQFLSIAIGSFSEMQTQLLISLNLKYISENDFNIITDYSREIERMLSSLSRKLKSKEKLNLIN
jgi:four helix bundle protein